MSLDAALVALRAGRVVGVPTDTVYGLAVDPADEEAVRSLFRIKGRGWSLPLAVLAASFDQVDKLVHWAEADRRLVEPHWPGPLTAVLSTRVSLAAGVGDHDRGTLAVRIPDHDLLRRLLARSGPLAVTSANPSGSAPALDSVQARALFGGRVSVYVEGERQGGEASTVVDLTRVPPVVLREGPIPSSFSR
ncbi:MAG: L-threonylcarbamoyladenylate synthase [bacterium]|nr:L-threonylcarbamoyladenylate synthase [bacterium]MDE0352935.1 L-threonylcarbamoyladenylate synthase [bacterium]